MLVWCILFTKTLKLGLQVLKPNENMCGMKSMTSMLKVHMIINNFISVRRNKKINDMFKKQTKQTNKNKTKNSKFHPSSIIM